MTPEQEAVMRYDPNTDSWSATFDAAEQAVAFTELRAELRVVGCPLEELAAFEEWFYSIPEHADWSCLTPAYALAARAWTARAARS